MKIFTIALTALAMTVGSGVAMAQTMVDVTSVEPAPGVTQQVGTPLLNFPSTPDPNPECKDYALLLLDGTAIASISTSESNRLQRFVEQPDESIRLVFSTTPYTEPGEYTVVVPEGFVTFNGGSEINAAYEFSYTILDSKVVEFEPVGGYYDLLPNVIKVTIPGVKEIVNNHAEYDPNTGHGGMPYFLPTEIVFDEPVIEGNTLTFTFAEKPYTSSGMYELLIDYGALTLTMEDGTVMQNPPYRVAYRKSLIPFPEINVFEGREHDGVYEVYEMGNFSMTLENGTFGQFMRNPSLYSVDKYGDKDARLFSFNLATYTVRGQKTINFVSTMSSPFETPGDYLLIIGKSSFSAKGPYNDKEYFGSGDDDDPSQSDEEIVEVWNNVDLMYRVRIIPSPAEVITDAPSAIASLGSFPLIFPNTKEIELPFTPVEEAPSIRDRFWREVKGYEITLEIVNPTAGEPVSGGVILTSEGGSPCKAMVHINPALTASKATQYSVYIPKGSFICDAEDSRQLIYEVTIDPTLTGIEAPKVEPAEGDALADKVTVVTPEGVVVLQDAPASRLFELPGGLYIINGKATMLR